MFEVLRVDGEALKHLLGLDRKIVGLFASCNRGDCAKRLCELCRIVGEGMDDAQPLAGLHHVEEDVRPRGFGDEFLRGVKGGVVRIREGAVRREMRQGIPVAAHR